MAYTSLSGSKLRAKLGGSLNESASAPTSAFARKQLENMGWSEGKGLGKNQQGITTHIKVKKREEAVGLGQQKPQQQEQWWADTCGDVLSRLSGKKKTATMTDDDLFLATGGARFGMRAQRKQTGKWSRAEKKDMKAEEEAAAKLEWDGTGQAKVVLTENKTKRQKKSEDDSEGPKRKKSKRDRATDINPEHSPTRPTKNKKEKKPKRDKESKDVRLH